jgi:hypothetical protein
MKTSRTMENASVREKETSWHVEERYLMAVQESFM